MPGLLHARGTLAPIADAPPPPPGASALERLRGKLSQPLDPRDPLSSLAPLIDSLRSASEYGRAVRSLESQGDDDHPRESPALPHRRAPLKTFPALDELLGGGLPRGKLVEMIGARSSGRLSIVLAAVAAATAAGEATALVDLGDGLDPEAAVALGADLRRLLWLRPGTLKQALAGAEILLGGGFPMVVLDLGNPPIRGGRGHEAAWLRLARAAQAQGAALLIASPYRVSGTAAAAVLQAARGRARWQGAAGGPCWLLDGLSCQVTLEKCRGRRLPARSLELELRLSPIVPAAPATTVTAEAPAAVASSAAVASRAAVAASAAVASSAAFAAPAAVAIQASAVPAAAAGQAGRTCRT